MIGYDPTSPQPFGTAPIIQPQELEELPPLQTEAEILELDPVKIEQLKRTGIIPPDGEFREMAPWEIWLRSPSLLGWPRGAWLAFVGVGAVLLARRRSS